jgi:superfamily II DNA or RNA helicase
MTKVPVIIAGGLEVRVDDLPAGAFELIKTALLVWNEDRQKKLDEKIWGAWNEPEWIPLYREEHRRDGSRVLLMPRGFASQLNYGLVQFGYEVEWTDMRSTADAEPGYYVPFVLRDYQIDAAIKLLQAEQGVYESPAGSGKTTTILGALAWADQRAIVIVDRANLLEQWRARAARFLGLSLDLSDPRSVGKIGEDVWQERDLTIALRQSLWSRLWEVQATGMFKRYGAVVVDEVHHAAADTLREIVSEAQTRLLWGVSATPVKTETKGKIVYSTIGPIVARTSREELYERDVLVKPSVELIFTGHDDVFWATHDATRAKVDGQMVWRCDVPDCRKAGSKHGHRNNYSSVKKHLVESEERAAIIAERVVSERGHVHLVASSELKHLDVLRAATEAAGWDGPIFMLRGEENAEGLSQDIATAIEEGGFWETYETKEENPATGRAVKVTKLRRTSHDMPHGREAVIFSTVAGEGLDIPPIDRVHVSFPMRQESAVIQLIGRGERTAPGKADSVIIDYRDRCSVFAEQGLERERVFRYLGLTIKEGRRAEAA